MSKAIPPLFLLTLNLFLFGPLSIYLGNYGEFQASYVQISLISLLPTAFVFFCLLVLYIILKEPYKKIND